MSVQLLKGKDNASGQLNAGISPSTLSIPLQTGEGADFPQPYTGTATSGGTRTTLNVTGIGATGVAVWDFIRNVTDGSCAFVLSVSTNSLTTTRLLDGSDNTWQNGDTYRVNEFTITLAAINADGNDTAYEEVLISNRSTDTLTVPSGGRGFNGTVAQSFAASDYVQLRVSAPFHEEIKKFLKVLQQDTDTTITSLLTLIAALVSTANGEGASMIGVEDADGNFIGNTVEEVLRELAAFADNLLPDAGNPGDHLVSDGDNWSAQPPAFDLTSILSPIADSSSFGTLGSEADAPTGYKKAFANGELLAGDVVFFEFCGHFSQGTTPKNVVMKIKLGSTALVTFATQTGASGTFWARGKFIIRATSGANNIEHMIDFDSTLPKVMTAVSENVNTSVTFTPAVTFAADTTSQIAIVDYFHVYKIAAP